MNKIFPTQSPVSMVVQFMAIIAFVSSVSAQQTAFTYQGRLNLDGPVYTGPAELEFTVWDAVSGGSQVAASVPASIETGVTNGLFAVAVDFGAGAFDGSARYLQIAVRTNLGPFTTLAPRQQVTPTPYAILAGGISGTLPAGALAGSYDSEVQFGNAANSFTGTFNGDGADLTNLDASMLTSGSVPAAALGNAWTLGGNSGTSAGTDFIGTTDEQPLELRVNGVRALVLSLAPSNSVNVIGGYAGNHVAPGVVGATIAGGGAEDYLGLVGTNSAAGDFGVIGGGLQNTVSNVAATIGGGLLNVADGESATIAGGSQNQALAGGTVIAGGSHNEALATGATVGGGNGNVSSNLTTTVAGGNANVAGGTQATVGGGLANRATGSRSTVGGGFENVANGFLATIPGGDSNTAAGESSFAAGRRAKADHSGSFVWADGNSSDFSSTAPHQFNVRATGGVRIITGVDGNLDPDAGVSLNANETSWNVISDRAVKKHFRPADSVRVLDLLTEVPIQRWNYEWETDDTPPHLGPTAQDFKAAFYPGRDDRTISTLEMDGVALAAIQGLNEKLEIRSSKSEDRFRRLESENAELRQTVNELKELVQVMNHKLNGGAQ